MSQDAKIISVIILATVIFVIFGIWFLSKDTYTGKPLQSQKVDQSLLIRQSSHQTSSSSASLSLVEFGDYQCPACRAAEPVLQKIKSEYKDKINFVFRNFPLPLHKNSKIAAQAAEAGGNQGKFWQMHDKIYETQDKWSESNEPLSQFISLAKDLGLDVEKFESDVKTNKFEDIIIKDQDDANALGVNATPTFFIDGEIIKGVPDYEQLKSKIDSRL